MPTPTRRLTRGMALVFLTSLALSACTLAGEPVPAGPVERSDAADLPLTATPPAIVDLPPDLGFPERLPDAANGAVVFAERCAACHGLDGGGAGAPLAATLIEQEAEVPDFTDLAFVRSRSPQEFFVAITEGNLDALMPPWGNELTEAERWDLSFYLYAFATPPESLAFGQVVYDANCAGCHGPLGAGDGPEATTPLPDLSDPAAAITHSPQALFDVVAIGAGDAMPAFGETLPEDQRWAVVDYLRALAYQPAAVGDTSEPAAPAILGTVRGTVTNVTAGAPLGAGETVLLHGLRVSEVGIQEIITLETTTDARGDFVFEDAPMDIGNLLYVVDVVHEGIAYSNSAFATPDESTSLDLPIEVYDTTQDPSVVSVESLHIVVSPQSADSVLIAQIYIYSNSDNRAYVSDQAISETRRGTVKLPVPPDAISLAFEDGELGGRYVQTTGGVLDTAAVLPGQQSHSAVMTYLLPYNGDRSLAIPVYYQTQLVRVLFEQTGLRVRAEGLEPTESSDPQLGQYEILGGEGFAPGDELVIALRGTPGAALPANQVGLLVAGGVAVLALGGAGVVWWRRRASRTSARQPAGATTGQRRRLMQAIADLDDAYEAGQLGQAQYEAQRARLKAELASVMAQEDGGV